MNQRVLTIRRDIQAEQKADAAAERARLGQRGTLVVNLLSSPGAGKTALLEATARHLAGRRSMAVLVGDLETDRDAQRLAPLVPVAQLTTGGACHLELPLVKRGLQALGDPIVDFLFIENVGNLVCPASHDLAEHLRVVLISTTEGDDKPGKYPKMFRTSQAMVVTKLDLLPHVPFSLEAVTVDALKIQPELEVLSTCALDGRGIQEWCDYLEQQYQEKIESVYEPAGNQ
ncbi:Hydrogenase isoenzymes nickel incorporation protein HypB [Gimesia panareensis]|uniref:Hydrogenase isoenzymes nickel incorporation protein HypB n=1 Tax=Gimesia panareensis TaxID=2527978 RepID=A0A518FSM0_9PLAN|nr:hydrogenase nickel incorporation protein HypB [Gimesia panareensis]QDV19295.1 Hydrogenase isoenzymes nickel incorporation protein HypB [Gimesia panareensis]